MWMPLLTGWFLDTRTPNVLSFSYIFVNSTKTLCSPWQKYAPFGDQGLQSCRAHSWRGGKHKISQCVIGNDGKYGHASAPLLLGSCILPVWNTAPSRGLWCNPYTVSPGPPQTFQNVASQLMHGSAFEGHFIILWIYQLNCSNFLKEANYINCWILPPRSQVQGPAPRPQKQSPDSRKPWKLTELLCYYCAKSSEHY